MLCASPLLVSTAISLIQTFLTRSLLSQGHVPAQSCPSLPLPLNPPPATFQGSQPSCFFIHTLRYESQPNWSTYYCPNALSIFPPSILLQLSPTTTFQRPLPFSQNPPAGIPASTASEKNTLLLSSPFVLHREYKSNTNKGSYLVHYIDCFSLAQRPSKSSATKVWRQTKGFTRQDRGTCL